MNDRLRLRHPRSARTGGQALLIVLGAIVTLTLLAASMASKVEIAGKASAELESHARRSIAESSALAAVTAWISTHRPGPGGWGDESGLMLYGDGREYRLPDGTLVSVQDQRGQLSINVVERNLMTRFLRGMGVADSRIDAMVDILEDYTDTDALRRLNGAEEPEYVAMGLAKPRNDWAVSTRELRGLPIWGEELRRNPRMLDLLSARRSAGLNPNTAPIDLLAAIFPETAAESLKLFENMRRERPFHDEETARRLTGVPLVSDDTSLWVGTQVWVRVRPPDGPRGREYNVLFTPASPVRPWIVLENRLLFEWPVAPSPQTPPSPFPAFKTEAHVASRVIQASR